MEAQTDLLHPGRRERLMVAMAALCAERGYEETSAEDVAARAGLAVEDFDAVFGGNRERCVLAALNAITGETMTAIASSYSPDRSEWDSYMLGIKAILELMAANPSFAHLAYVGSRQMGPPALGEAHHAAIKVVTAMLERLWDYSKAETQPATTARGALGAAEAVVRREVAAGRAAELPRLLPDFVYAATVPFLGQEEALRLVRRARELLAGTAWG
ncbi:MAG TPA: hypothetical protein VFJ57_00110 [Solirubrobacterales bacterium]|nr:hypothetical protein [Solirubrobacterales bacterium]